MLDEVFKRHEHFDVEDLLKHVDQGSEKGEKGASAARATVYRTLKELVEAGDQSNGRKLTAELTWNVGVFLDQDDNLLASAVVSGLNDYALNVNIYPGVLRIGPVSPGAFCAVGREGQVITGVSFARIPIGVAARVYR